MKKVKDRYAPKFVTIIQSLIITNILSIYGINVNIAY